MPTEHVLGCIALVDRVCTLLFVAHHVCALAERRIGVLEHVTQTQRVAIQSTLLTQLATE